VFRVGPLSRSGSGVIDADEIDFLHILQARRRQPQACI
jgi:hypothetical protein